jgi:hypothetical protein
MFLQVKFQHPGSTMVSFQPGVFSWKLIPMNMIPVLFGSWCPHSCEKSVAPRRGTQFCNNAPWHVFFSKLVTWLFDPGKVWKHNEVQWKHLEFLFSVSRIGQNCLVLE